MTCPRIVRRGSCGAFERIRYTLESFALACSPCWLLRSITLAARLITSALRLWQTFHRELRWYSRSAQAG